MATANQILKIAEAEAGYHESGSNRTKFGKVYGWDGVSWCAIFVWWCFHQAGAEGLLPEKTASAPDLASAFARKGQYGHTPRPGAVVFFDLNGNGGIDHVGLVIGTLSDGRVKTVEGNTSDGVYIRYRSRSLIKGYGYPRYSGSTTTTEELLKTLVDLGAEQPQTVKAGERASLCYELTYSDPGKIHTKPKNGERFPSIFPTGADAPYSVTAEVRLSARPDPGVFLTITQYARKGNDLERDVRGVELATSREVLDANVRMSDKNKFRVDIVNHSARDVVVDKAYLLIAH